jgi:hypothetical protein
MDQEELKSDKQFRQNMIDVIGKILFKSEFNVDDDLKLGNWINRAAASTANAFNKIQGPPDEVKTEKNGYVIWYDLDRFFGKKNDKYGNYHCMIIKDIISDIHFTPVIHIDFLFMGIKIDVEQNIIDELPDVSDGLWYDNEIGVLYAGGSFPGACISQLAVIKRIINKSIKNHKARSLYEQWVKMTYEEWNEVLDKANIEEALFTVALEKYILTSDE